jgi:hypothetical protein
MMKLNKKADAQILVIILLVLSILSIFVLSMVTNAQKDTKAKQDDKKYQQFYSIGEQNLVLAQGLVGTKALDAATIKNALGADPTLKVINCVDVNDVTSLNRVTKCDLEPVNYEINNLDQVATTLYFTDEPNFELATLLPNNDLELSLDNGTSTYTGDLTLNWNYPVSPDPVKWIVTLDYYVPSNDPAIPSYKSVKISSISDTLATNPSVEGFSQAISFNIKNDFLDPFGLDLSVITIKDLRIMPIVPDGNPDYISINLDPYGAGFPAQFRKITAVVNSTNSNLTGNSSPTVVLNLQYPITLQINPLLDYVYRGRTWIQDQ